MPELLEAIVRRVPPPRGDPDAPLRALIFDSYYDRYRGAIPSIRVVDGAIRPGMRIAMGSHEGDLRGRGGRVPAARAAPHRASSTAGEVGYVVASVREVKDTRVGRHDPRRRPAAPRSCSPATATSSRWCSRASTRPRPSSTRTCATRSPSCSSTTRRCTTSRRPRWRSASASAAASSACCTWRSCRSGWSASSTSTSSPPCRTWSTTCTSPSGEKVVVENPSQMPTGSAGRPDRGAVRASARIITPAEYIGAMMKLGQERRGDVPGDEVPRPDARRVRLGVPARRDHPRLLRQAEDAVARLRLARLRVRRSTGRATS